MTKKIFISEKFLFLTYPVLVVSLFLYSLTQIDLNLFLFKFDAWVNFQRFFQNIGYFQRPLSTYIYVSILILLFISYLGFLFLVQKKRVSEREVWKLIIFCAVLLTFSYNAFSYDLFNYVFDAKIITHYNQNPYFHKALDFPGDPMLNFMHWTHRTYPYGPGWLALTVPLSFLGFNFFLPTILMFKTLASLSYFGTVYFIGKILNIVDKKNVLFGTVFFALNPLVIVEGLVSGHLDIVMTFFGVLSFYFLFRNKNIHSIIALIFSASIKFVTVVLLPLFLLKVFGIFKDKLSFEKVSMFTIFLMIIGIIASSVRTNFQPWYLLYALPYAVFLAKKNYVLIPSVVLSFVALLMYVPFLYTGNWNPPIPTILNYILGVGVLSSIVLVFIGSRMVKS